MSNHKEYRFKLSPFVGKLDLIDNLTSLVERRYADMFVAVLAHGSVGSCEVVPYSDFDGLLIVKDKFRGSSALRAFKKESFKLILNFDPLQHHGWFEIFESQLGMYPDHYLPVEALEKAQVIYPRTSVDILCVVARDETRYTQNLKKISQQISAQLNGSRGLQTTYGVKSLLSKLMLVPALYYSHIHKKGIDKAESFRLTKEFFSADEWYCISIASDIRLQWDAKEEGWRRLIMTRSALPFRRLTKYLIAPPLSPKLQRLMDKQFYDSVKSLLRHLDSV